ncbi:MAG: universal stress protein [Actinomycetota bacterium]|nr:universal stress protein [Actinomycetota bacterium]
MKGPVTVVVGTDGSAAAAGAMQWAADLVLVIGGEVVAVHALGLLSHMPTNGSPASGEGGTPTAHTATEHRTQIEAQLHRWCVPLQASGVAHRCLVSDGSPVLALLQAATDAAADLIVVGRRGSGGFPGLLLGSTSHELTAHAHLPVVVVPGPVEQPAR